MSNAFARMYNVGHHAGSAPQRNAMAVEQTELLKHQNAFAKHELKSAQDTANFFANGGRGALAGLATGAPNAMSAAFEAGAPIDLIAKVQGLRNSDIAANVTKFELASNQMKQLGQAVFGVEQLPVFQRPSAYQALRQQYAGMGMDVSQWPESYGPQVTAYARQIPEAAKALDSRIAGVRTVPAGAPAGGGQVAGGGLPPMMRPEHLSDYFHSTLAPSESGGDPNAKNPNSSASGLAQMTDGTFLRLFRREFPAEAAGLTDAQIMAYKNDPQISLFLGETYLTKDVMDAFEAAGFMEISPGMAKLGYMGPGRVGSIYGSPDNRPITEVIEPEAMAANPQWQGLQTVGDLRRWAEENQARYGAGSAGAQAGVQGGAQGTGQPQFLMTGAGTIATDGAPKGYGWTPAGVAPLPGYQTGEAEPPPTTGLPDGYQWAQGQNGWEAAPIAGLPPEAQGGALLGQGNAVDDRIFNTLKAWGYQDQEALDLATMVRPFTDPLSGQQGLMNIRTGQPIQPKAGGQMPAAGQPSRIPGPGPAAGRGPVPAGGGGQDAAPLPPQQQSVLQQIQVAEDAPSLFDLAEDTAGLGSWLENAATRIGGMFDLGGFPKTTTARQYVKAAQQQLITALSINARNPVAEQERLREQINLDPQIFDSTEALQARQVAVDQLLRQKLASEQRIADDLNQSPQARRQAQMKAASIQQFLAILGVPPVIRSKEQYDALPEGTEYWHAQESEVRIKGAQ